MTRIAVEPEAMIVPCLVWLFCGDGALTAVLLASVVHELGHLAAILFGGGFIEELRIGFSGAEIKYDGINGRMGHFFAALGGPAAGLLLAVCVFRSGDPNMKMLVWVNIFLSLFNLLPASPLDGGQAVRAITEPGGEKLVRGLDIAVLAGVWLASIYVLCAFRSPLLLPGAVSLTICCCNTEKDGVRYI